MARLRSQAPFTKGEVNRAGDMLLDLRERMERDGAERAVAESDESQLDRAWDALTWWRSLHARPLSSVAANLRYHVDKEGGRVQGRIVVAQRLKRLPTMIDKLTREKGRITQMYDVGFKFGQGSKDVRAAFIAMADVLATFDRGEITLAELIPALQKPVMMNNPTRKGPSHG